MQYETIAIYVRVSTQEQAKEGYSVDEQLNRLRKYCEAHDWKLVKEYVDPGYSGAKLERPAIQQLIKDVESRKISRVLVYKLDRLSRSQKDTLYLIEDVFLKHDTAFVSMTENFDTSTPFGKAMIGILSVFAQLEREQIKERMTMGKVGRAKDGKWIGSHKVPIGYKYTDGFLVVDPYEAEIIKIIFDQYSKGVGVKNISNYLYDHGMKSSYGLISKATIYFILHNPVYTGMVNYSGDVYQGIHEPIISKELFDKCQARFEMNKENPRFAVNMNNFTKRNRFTGLFRCTCGARMRVFYGAVRKDGTRQKYYGCDSRSTKQRECLTKNGMVPAVPVEDHILEILRKIKLDPEAAIEAIQNERTDNLSPDEKNRVDLIKTKIGDIEKQIEKLIRLYSIQNIDFEIVTKQISELSEEKTKLTETLRETQAAIEESESTLSIEETLEALDMIDLESLSLDPFVKSEDDAKINEVLRILIDQIIITRDTIDIHWNI